MVDFYGIYVGMCILNIYIYIEISPMDANG